MSGETYYDSKVFTGLAHPWCAANPEVLMYMYL